MLLIECFSTKPRCLFQYNFLLERPGKTKLALNSTKHKPARCLSLSLYPLTAAPGHSCFTPPLGSHQNHKKKKKENLPFPFTTTTANLKFTNAIFWSFLCFGISYNGSRGDFAAISRTKSCNNKVNGKRAKENFFYFTKSRALWVLESKQHPARNLKRRILGNALLAIRRY